MAEVYLAMTRGQETLSMELDVSMASGSNKKIDVRQLELSFVTVSQDDAAAHQEILELLAKKSKKGVVWGQEV